MMDKDTYLGEDGRWYIKNTEQQPPHRSSGVEDKSYLKSDSFVLAKMVYDKISILDPKCILAGGAPRDWYLGRTPKDLDFYLDLGESFEYYGEVEYSLSQIGLEVKKERDMGNKASLYSTMNNLIRVLKVDFQGNKIPIQLIQIKGRGDYPSFTRGFNNSLSQVWYDFRKDTLEYTTNFKTSVDTKTVVCFEGGYNINKYRKYFPDWNFIIR